MKRPGLIIFGILVLATALFTVQTPWATIALIVLVGVVICLPPKWDPAIQYKANAESDKSHGGQKS